MKASSIRVLCIDWGDTLMLDDGPQDLPMALWPKVTLVSGATEMLEALSRRLPLCIATNATMSDRPMVERALERGGLSQYFSNVFTFTDLGFKKDAREFWEAVATTMGVEIAEIGMLGDSLESDVLAPLSFGVQAVWFNPFGRTAPPPGVTSIRRLEEFPTLLGISN